MSHSSKIPEPAQPAWKAYLNPKLGGVLAAVVLVGGLAFYGLTANNKSASPDEMNDEEMLIGLQTQSLGAMGVSDSASPATEKTPPLEFPAAAEAEASANPGPLFGGGLAAFDSPTAKADGVTSASFERPLPGTLQAPAVRPGSVTPRAVANQPVWLTGTIETSSEK